MGTTGKALYRRQLAASLLCTCLIASGVLLAYFVGLFRPADNYLYDVNLVLRGTQPVSGRISLVLMDEESAQRLQRERGQWSRSRLAAALDHLCQAGAEVVGLDMIMAAPDLDPEEDQRLANAMASCNNVVLARVSAAEGVREIAALDLFQEAMIGDGFIDVPLDQDGVLRKIRFLSAKPLPDGTLSLLPAFALELARVYLNLDYQFDFRHESHFLLGTAERHLKLPYPELLINYGGGYSSFDIISFADATDNNFDPELVRGRIILVGSTLSSEKDFFTTPLSRFQSDAATLAGRFAELEMGIQGSDEPGVACHAYALENILSQSFLTYQERTTTLWYCLAVAVFGLLFYLPRLSGIWEFSLLITGLLLLGLATYLALSHLLVRMDVVPVALTLLLQFVGGVTLQKVFGSKQTAMITAMFGKYVSSGVVRELIKGDISTTLEGHRVNLTILFSDLRGFTTLSEKLGAKDTARLLNTYFDAMVPLVFTYRGTLDKLMGDAIMAFFGAPIPVDDHPTQGAATALAMCERLRQLKQRKDIEGLADLNIGIGLNTGEVTVGNLGSNQFMNYTIIGDAVNLASRLEGLNKTYGTTILISHSLAEQLDNNFLVRDLDIVRVKGKKKAVPIYELVGRTTEVPPAVTQGLQLFAQGLSAYRQQHWDDAESNFQQTLTLLPTDGPSKLYLQRIDWLRNNPPEPGWDGVATFTHK